MFLDTSRRYSFLDDRNEQECPASGLSAMNTSHSQEKGHIFVSISHTPKRPNELLCRPYGFEIEKLYQVPGTQEYKNI